MTPQRPIRSMPELIAALRDRAHELQLTHQTIDSVAGLQDGYTSKLLAPTPIKNLGPVSFEAMLGALGLAVVVVEDPEQVARVQNRWTKRERPARNPTLLASALSMNQQIQITPDLQAQLQRKEYMKMLGAIGGKKGGSKGGKRRLKTMGKRARQRAASHAARMRWAKQGAPNPP